MTYVLLWLLKYSNKFLSNVVVCMSIHVLFYNTTRSEKGLAHKKSYGILGEIDM